MTEHADTRLTEAYESCRRVTASRARSFYLGLRLAPEPERSALYALYAWNRMGDDIVDETSAPRATRLARLEEFSDDTRKVFGNDRPPDEALWIALADVTARFPIDAAWLEAMLRGLKDDLDHTQPETLDELARYCDDVAGSVGRCCVAIWGLLPDVSAERAYMLADRLGRAFQLTNILRDIGEDTHLDPPRHYIPRSILVDHEITTEALLAWSNPDACRALVLGIAAEARRCFGAGEELLSLIQPRFRPTLWAMHQVYARTLGLIEQEPRRSVRLHHVRPGKVTTMSIACRAFAMSAIASRHG